MKIFISWSGPESLKIAKILRDWIPNVIQAVKPYVSAEDIDKGTRWAADISKELDDSLYGIICLTKGNISAPWINFEAGALSKKVDKSKVSPFLFKIKPSEVTGPILQFQHTRSDDKEDILKLVSSINKQGEFLTEERLNSSFEQWWPKLEADLSGVIDSEAESKEPAKQNKHTSNAEIQNLSQIVESLLDISRTNHQLLRNPEVLLPEEYVKKILGKTTNQEVVMTNVTNDLVDSLSHLSRLRRIILRSSKDEAAINHYLEELESIIDSLSKPVDYMQKKFLEESTTLPRTIRLRRRQLNLMDDPDSEGRGN
ncbi:toll/interleukin-1 receptor domain-containing protein [Klebsiella pneumoniae]|uniref:TIR domain-containing protein n=4 Tax=Enterobacterales TaxID=91347 RepID=UPI0009BAA0D0|nr:MULTISPECIES: TIR domain-containing protein [Enterobacteriaceae]HAK5280193.1 TIR domain-containing protein [Salmonella enterica]HBP6339708.1 TIR domain-containing protein [Pseudomonas aeruginosa]HDS4710484.1 toll/interleukin-1 receptor domain-containing protein [Klebsiella pneumoniae subsp. pneumoniae]EIW9253774.1 TIR domain-containing protein [Klebsiella pneumoniae]EKZ9980280.1 toll/interleukin-1 receptor domain-containing protein [Klebsiella pneumoniae]